MKIIPYDRLTEPQHIRGVKQIIDADGIVVYPTDTLYGLGGNFLSPAVHDTIDRLKGRKDMPYSVVVPGPDMLATLVEYIPDTFQTLYELLLPGKFTFLLPVSRTIDPALVRGGDKIGIRIPGMPKILELTEKLGAPLISTSVNRSGEAPLTDPERIAGDFPADVLIDGGVLPPSKGSTILDLCETPVRCIRRGDDAHRLAGITCVDI